MERQLTICREQEIPVCRDILVHKPGKNILKLLAKTEQNLGEKVWVKLNDMKYMKNGITPGL